MLWKLFFEICDILCSCIPIKDVRHRIRREKLFDWRKKYNALRKKYPELNFWGAKMIKGGWNIGFIVDNKYVFKIKKRFDSHTSIEKITREKRITDAFANISPLRIPKIEIVHTGGYTFYKYDFIPGKNLNFHSLRAITKNAPVWGQQLAEFIYAIHNAHPHEIDDLRGDRAGDGWNHNDICNNVIVDKKTKKIIGVIDWEYAGWGTLESEFNNTVFFSSKLRKSGIKQIIMDKYAQLKKNSK